MKASFLPSFVNKAKALERAEHYQNQLHQFTEEIKQEKPDIEYQDIVTTFFCLKLAEIESGLSALSNTAYLPEYKKR